MNKKILLIVCVLLVAVLAAATVLYNNLADDVELGGLATQPPATTQPEAATEGSEAAPTEGSEAPDTAAPDVLLTDRDGNEVHLSDFAGKPIILNFWASWCGPCKSEMPDLEEAYLKYGDEIHFLMVNCTDGSRETVQIASDFIADAGYTFPVYFDTTYEAAYTYGASSIPLTYFIDAEGNLTAYYMGAMSASILQQGIDMIYTEE